MTEKLFFELLSLTPRFWEDARKWENDQQGIVRCYWDGQQEKHCPITAVSKLIDGIGHATCYAAEAGLLLDLKPEFITRVIQSADGAWGSASPGTYFDRRVSLRTVGADWEARRDIERACGTQKLLTYQFNEGVGK